MKPRILVVDDEEGIRESLGLILGQEYDVDFASDGEEALQKIGGGNFSAALLDIKMPKLDGLEVLKRLQGEGSTLPVLMLTAYQSVELAKEAIRLGARDYLPKPFEQDQILNAVRGVVNRT